MKLSIFKNTVNEAHQIPYVLCVSLDGDVIPPDTTYHVPIYFDQVPHARGCSATCYNLEICGFRLEAASPDELLVPAASLLTGLINMARLPTYIFAAGDSMLIYPVYTVGDEVFATTQGGPMFRHVELAKVRSYLSDYLHTMKELGTLKGHETLHVRGVDTNTLGLIRPAFYLKKRVIGENEFWVPVFRALDRGTVYTYAASAKREVHVDRGLEVLDLQAVVAAALAADGRLSDPYDLRPDRLFADTWQQLKAHLQVQPYCLRYPANGTGIVESPIYRYGKIYLAAEHRDSEDRYNILLGHDPADLRRRAGQEFLRRKLITDETSVELLVL
jgi:hypothetical protein